jgi:peptidoglycan/LPS O-acetylase OafA/YrhL
MIQNIQALRAFAAISVAIYHTGYNLFGKNTDFSAVAFFCSLAARI